MVWGWIVTIALVLWFCWWFVHRDPDRFISPSNGFLSPADGVILRVIDVKSDKQFIQKNKNGFTAFLDDFPDARYIVVIMLKIWHVHTQRSPIAGTVTRVEHKDGTKQNAVFGDVDKATAENEHLGVTIKGKKTCKVYMVAGLVARRVVGMVRQNDTLTQGARIARIKLGSQCVLVLPESKIKVAPGDRVYGGLTEIAS